VHTPTNTVIASIARTMPNPAPPGLPPREPPLPPAKAYE